MKRNYENIDPSRGRNTGRTRGRGYGTGGGRGRGGRGDRRGNVGSDDQRGGIQHAPYEQQHYGGRGHSAGRDAPAHESGGPGGGSSYYGGYDDPRIPYHGRSNDQYDYSQHVVVPQNYGVSEGHGESGGYHGGASHHQHYQQQQQPPHPPPPPPPQAHHYQPRSDSGRGGAGRFQERGRGRGGHYGGREARRGGRGRGGRTRPYSPDMSNLDSCLSNIILADVSENFHFFMYPVQTIDSDGRPIESRHRRKFLFESGLWNGLLENMAEKEKEDLERVVFFQGSFFFSARKIPGLESENLPLLLPISGDRAEGDGMKVMQVIHYIAPAEFRSYEGPGLPERAGDISFDKRCADCTTAFKDVGALMQHCQHRGHKPVYSAGDEKEETGEPVPAPVEVFNAFTNLCLKRALSERLARWGSEYIDPTNMKEPVDRSGRSLGVRVYEAYSCQFGMMKATPDSEPKIGLTVDLRAKIVRTLSVMDHLVGEQGPDLYDPSYNEQERCRRQWIGEVIISMHDKKCYSVTDLIFDRSAESMPVEGLGMSHAEYFERRKNIKLKYPNFRPLIAVLGRRNQSVYLPAELVAGNQLEARVKQQLPMIASYKPELRNAAIEKIRAYLIPGAQKSKGAGGLLPAVGIHLADSRLDLRAEVLQVPMMMAAGIQVPASRAENWAPMLNRASFNISPKESNTLQVIVFYNERIRGAVNVYNRIRDLVNNFNATYRFSDKPVQFISTGDRERHWGAVEKCFSDETLDPENVFVLDFNKPKGTSDPAYPVIKQILTKSGFLSQFINFNTYAHDSPRDQRRSELILQGAARQILQKTGVRLWWVQIPRSLPTPTVVVGVDVFHAPRVYDPVEQKRVAKASCAAIIVQVFRNSGNYRSQKIEIYTKTYARESGKEYELGDALKETVSTALRELDVSPTSCIVWRDGIGDSAFGNAASEEIDAVRDGLRTASKEQDSDVPLAYIVAQKRIATKFLSKGIAGEPDGKFGAPAGTLVKGIQGLTYETFYINGRAPPYSTGKPVRYVVVKKDAELNDVPIEKLTWNLSHDYPNWTGPVKVPSAIQMAHKLAELGGSFADCGKSINSQKLKNKLHFL